jgi:hypothetical protein
MVFYSSSREIPDNKLSYIWPRPLPSTPFQIDYSAIIQPHETVFLGAVKSLVRFEVLTAAVTKSSVESQLTFRRNISPPSSESKNKASKKQT